MKVEELMINDWVRVPSELNREKRIRSTFDMDSAVLYEPVPLTPEILKKNGFKLMTGFGYSTEYPTWGLAYLDEFSEHFSIDITIFNYPLSGVKILVRMERNSLCGDGINKIHSCDIGYLHELQHALKLCGINKEIIL